MDEVEVTWLRGLKLWWSFMWRGMVLSLAVMIPLQIVMAIAVIPTMAKMAAHPGQPPDPQQMFGHVFAIFAILYPIVLAGIIALQVQALRWMLKRAKWSDFQVRVVRKDDSFPQKN